MIGVKNLANLKKTEAIENAERLVKQKRLIDLSITLLKLKILPIKEIEINLQNYEDVREVLLVAPKGKVLTMQDGRKIFHINSLMELEEFVDNGMRRVRRVRSDVVWAALVGIFGLFGLIFGSLPPLFSIRKDKAKIRRWIDEKGNIVYVAEDPSGSLAHLLLASFDRRYYKIYEPLASTLKLGGYYLLKFTYPASASSWQEVLRLQIDPEIEVLLEP
jgi:hypothetical protein